MPDSQEATTTIEDNISDKDRQNYRYWMSCIKRSVKMQPTKAWEDAEIGVQIVKGKKDKDDKTTTDDVKPYVSGIRLHYEASKSFLDQNEPTFEVQPTKPFINDETAIKQAECDSAYLEYIWHEQNLQVEQSKKLDSTLQRNIGFTRVFFNVKKWMPCLKYVPARNVLLDPDCGSIQKDAAWQGYFEDISIEELRAKNPSLTTGEIKEIKQHSTLADDDIEDYTKDHPDDKRLYSVVRLYHIFARNDAAVREMKEDVDEEKPITKSLAEELELTTPKRYLQFVKGFPKALVDKDWPFMLDDDEFPITALMFNTPVESDYGFTDNDHMSRLDNMCDFLLSDIENSAYWTAAKKFAGGVAAGDLKDTDLDKFLKDPARYYIANFLDTNNEPKVKQIDVGEFSPELVSAYDLADKERSKASALGELLATEAKEYKDVTAIAARIHDSNVHQKVNRRLGGPMGYEKSITDDAVKLLEIAHQKVPRYSLLEYDKAITAYNDFGQAVETGETFKDYKSAPWNEAVQMIQQGAKLIMLGIDAIVGPELAQYWRTTSEFPPVVFKLSTQVRVLPGSTRSITKEHKAAVLKQYYLEAFFPLYVELGRLDLAVAFLKQIGNLAGFDKVENLLPSLEDTQKFQQELEARKQQEEQAQAEQMQLEEEKMRAEQEQAGAQLDLDERSEEAKEVIEIAKVNASVAQRQAVGAGER